MRRFQALLPSLCLALAAPAAAWQAPPAETPSIYGEVIDVRVVNVEVVVTDRQGNRVPDLKPGDFRLTVDGKEVPIEYFTEVRSGQSVAAPAAEGEAAPAGPPSATPGGAVGTSYLVFVDDFFPVEFRRNEVLKSLKDQLAQLRPEDRMAIVAWDGGRISVLSNWSGSQNQLARAFDMAMGRKARGLDRANELRSFRNDVAFSSQTVGDNTPLDTFSRMDSSSLNGSEVAYADTLARQIEGATSAVVSAMRGFANPPGRKVLLLLSGGWPYSIVSFIRGNGPIPTSRQVPDGEQLLRPLANTANLLGYTIYPVDVPGVGTATATPEADAPFAFSSFGEQEIEGTLRFLAQETGGTPLVNNNRSVALAKTSEDLSSYYWLGFSPTWKGDDKRHKVDVKVTRPGLEVRSRTGFLDLSKKAGVSMMAESALLFGGFPGSLELPMRLGTPVKTKRGTIEIPVTLGLPASLLTLVPNEGKIAAELELRVAASDENGNSSEMPVIPLKLASDKPPKAGGFVRYDTKITLKGKADNLVVAVYDPVSGKIATAQAKVPVPTP
ncbi:MAG TPA: VWA domain-containing protein [Thermoanaerobaculia bacterium]|nr:VWA domain-containing protein [Thermoanaerobaculia bacterium]